MLYGIGRYEQYKMRIMQDSHSKQWKHRLEHQHSQRASEQVWKSGELKFVELLMIPKCYMSLLKKSAPIHMVEFCVMQSKFSSDAQLVSIVERKVGSVLLEY